MNTATEIRHNTACGELVVRVERGEITATLGGSPISPKIEAWTMPHGGINGPVGTIGGNVALYEAELSAILVAVATHRFEQRPSTKALREIGRATRKGTKNNQSALVQGLKFFEASMSGCFGLDVLASKAGTMAIQRAADDYSPAIDGPQTWHRAVMHSIGTY